MLSALPLTLSLAISASAPQSAANPHQAYAEILSAHVADGRVNYKSLADRDLKKLDGYLAVLAKAELPSDRKGRIGFLIDAYNATVLRSVITHGRPRSVLDVKDFFKAKAHTIAGRKVSLDQLEKEILNPYAKDPRTHFVLVCAAVGCPILESKPFYGDDVDHRMDVATRRYLAGPTGSQARPGEVAVSKIFDWYAKDFGGAEGAKKFILRHLGSEARRKVGANPKVSFVDYNWTLNQR